MTNRQQRFVFGLMAANALLFVVIFLWVASNYRLAADDFHHVVMVKNHGIWETMVFYYQNWNPRWSSILITNSFLSKGENQSVLFLFHVCSLLLGFVSIWSFTSAINKTLKLPFTRIQISIISIYLLAIAFYISFEKNDTWYWITVAPMYLWGTFAAFLGGSLLLQHWIPIIRRVLTFLIFLFAGGASESAAIATLLTLLFLGIKTRRHETNWLDRNALHAATLGCMVGFGISMIGPGIQIRREHLPHYPFGEKLLVGLWNYIKFNLKEIPLKLPLLILFVAPFGFFGRKQLRFQLVSIKEIFWANKTIWILSDLIILTLAMALGMVMCEMGPTRAWFPISVVMLMVGVVTAYQLGTWFYIFTKGRLIHFTIAALSITLIYQVHVGYTQISQTSEYAHAVDERMDFIHTVESSAQLIELEPLPSSGWLFSSEISTDTAHFTNMHLGLFFNHKSKFVRKDTVTSD